MQYMGGKSRISKQIAEEINEVSGRKIKNSKTNLNGNHERMFNPERERERVIRL